MKKSLFTIYFWLMFIICTLLGLIIFPLFLLVFVFFLRRPIDAAIRWGICIYGWVLVEILPFLAPVEADSQLRELPLPAIFVPNHNSAIDPYLFGALLTDVCFVTSWAFKIPIYGFFMRLARYVNANEGWEKIHQKGAAILNSGTSLIIWPEGHRSRDGSLGRFKNGAFALAVETGYPLVPVCILGSGKFLPPGQFVISPSRVKLILLDPIYPDMQNDRDQEIIRMRDKAEEVIRKKLMENTYPSSSIPHSKGFLKGEKC